jgi:hypothetical protein
MKAIKEKELENQYNLKQKETEDAILNIKRSAAREVEIRRNNLKKIIDEMRKKQNRKKSQLTQRLQSVKNQMAQTMGKAYKKGNLENCSKIGHGTETKQKIEMRKNFCTANFGEDYTNYEECLYGDDFCHLCCDTEFGEFHEGERQNCYNNSCTKSIGQTEKEIDNEARWVWQKGITE